MFQIIFRLLSSAKWTSGSNILLIFCATGNHLLISSLAFSPLCNLRCRTKFHSSIRLSRDLVQEKKRHWKPMKAKLLVKGALWVDVIYVMLIWFDARIEERGRPGEVGGKLHLLQLKVFRQFKGGRVSCCRRHWLGVNFSTCRFCCSQCRTFDGARCARGCCSCRRGRRRRCG